MNGPPVPEAILEFLSGNCVRRSCKLPTCTCLANGMKCSHICKLRNCGNQLQEMKSNIVYGYDDNYIMNMITVI